MFSFIESCKDTLSSLGVKVHFQEQTASTNSWAKTMAYNQPTTFTAFLTEQQTAGRGRGSNKWNYTTPGEQLFLTLAVKLNKPPQPLATAKLGLYLIKSLNVAWPHVAWNLKAPNDIYINSKKVIGILTEVQQQGSESVCLFGIGMNVYGSPAEITTSTSLKEEDIEVDQASWELFLKTFIAQVKAHLEDFSLHQFSPFQQEELLKHLNLHPLLKEKYISIDANGDLVTSTDRIPWQQL